HPVHTPTSKPTFEVALSLPAHAVGAPGCGTLVGAEALPPKILNMTTPQVGHLPLIALRPFFINSSTASAISFFALHLTQYPSAIKSPEKKTRLQRRVDVGHSLRVGC